VTGIGLIDRPRIAAMPETARAPRPISERDVYVGDAFQPCPVFARDALDAGAVVDGPAIIEEYGSTTLVGHNQRARVDPFGNVILRMALL
jgi:N-methylhydantoinase A